MKRINSRFEVNKTVSFACFASKYIGEFYMRNKFRPEANFRFKEYFEAKCIEYFEMEPNIAELPTVHLSLLTVHCLMPTVHCLMLTAGCPLSTALCLLSTIYCSLSTAHCPLSSTHCPLHSDHCLLPTFCCISDASLVLLAFSMATACKK
jgi:hypothetical protein